MSEPSLIFRGKNAWKEPLFSHQNSLDGINVMSLEMYNQLGNLLETYGDRILVPTSDGGAYAFDFRPGRLFAEHLPKEYYAVDYLNGVWEKNEFMEYDDFSYREEEISRIDQEDFSLNNPRDVYFQKFHDIYQNHPEYAYAEIDEQIIRAMMKEKYPETAILDAVLSCSPQAVFDSTYQHPYTDALMEKTLTAEFREEVIKENTFPHQESRENIGQL